jgi:tetratricopeptide (TPR) repeat protein
MFLENSALLAQASAKGNPAAGFNDLFKALGFSPVGLLVIGLTALGCSFLVSLLGKRSKGATLTDVRKEISKELAGVARQQSSGRLEVQSLVEDALNRMGGVDESRLMRQEIKELSERQAGIEAFLQKELTRIQNIQKTSAQDLQRTLAQWEEQLNRTLSQWQTYVEKTLGQSPATANPKMMEDLRVKMLQVESVLSQMEAMQHRLLELERHSPQVQAPASSPTPVQSHEVAAASPTASAPAEIQGIQTYLNNAKQLLHRNQYAEAIQNLDIVLDTDQTNSEAWYYRASALALTGNIEDAITYLHYAIQLDPHWAHQARTSTQEFGILASDFRFAELVNDAPYSIPESANVPDALNKFFGSGANE